MTAKVITEYLEKREQNEQGARSPHVRFTFALLKSLPVKPFDYEVRDTDSKGRICRVRKSGVKSIEIYKKPKGQPSAVRINVCQLGGLEWKSGIATRATVESETHRILAELRQGINPNKQNKIDSLKVKATEIPLTEATASYLKNADIKDSTKKGYEAIIRNHFNAYQQAPLIGILDKGVLSKLHKEITQNTGPVAANNAMRVLRAISNFIRQDMEDTSGISPIPLWPIKHKQQSKRFWNKESRRTGWIKPEYLKDWWNATEELVDEYQGDGETARDYLQFVLLSGLRRREATGLDWADIDFKTKSFTIDDTKNHQTLELPCSSHMIKILKRRQGCDTGPFKIDEPKKFVAWVRQRSGVHFTVHDLRRSFLTYAESLDFGAYTIKALVNHSAGGNSRDVTEGYLQLSVERLRTPMNKISAYVLQHAKQPSNVVEISDEQ